MAPLNFPERQLFGGSGSYWIITAEVPDQTKNRWIFFKEGNKGFIFLK